ncbi:MAG: dTDP-4-dehydrorhamnose reductase [Parvularculaceae bacterium]|nr:dTDP-4-dehydrorhamnose reductase [Parvularculaceae bacterium]
MRVFLFGANGQVGRETLAAAHGAGARIIAPGRADADLSVPGAAADAIRLFAPDAVINAAAWTAVDKAEEHANEAFRINAEAVGEIAAAASEVGARFIHLSTDYVFPGTGSTPLSETAPTGPLNVYGASKLKGEALALAANANSVIIRTSWVYSVHGVNFVKTMLGLSKTRDELAIVDDQRGGPTPASAVAAACLQVAARRDGPSGLYHFQGAPDASWADFAEAIFAAAGKRMKINRIPTSAYKTPARRPLFTVLNCAKLLRDYGVHQPEWRGDVERAVRRLIASHEE